MPDAIVERDGPTMIITMNRPQRYNALSPAMLVRMYDAMVEADEDPEIRCVILTGAGGNFSSGADLRAMAGDAGDADTEIDVAARTAADPDLIYKGILRLYRPSKPFIAAVEGVAIAGGTEILQQTDIRIAGESARFGVSEVRWSLYPMGGSAVRLRRQIPYTHAAEILLTGKHLTAAEAARIGLIGHVVPDGEALTRANEIAATIAENGPIAVEAVLRTLRETDGMTEAEALAHEWDYGRAVFETDDSREGPRAFAEKRKPNFTRT
ncbi:MAG TPA: crotonase/enoyl-CoA hydratase family protein [Acidimicrobiia bacterium]|nr:crotonase/enoyl-CoA hydratase family protein [Acidimicrobiia bacterium]